MRHPHFFICPRCGEPTDKLKDLLCLSCSEILKERESAPLQIEPLLMGIEDNGRVVRSGSY